jgi:TetR/AcrR family transcriptional regulator
MHRWSEPYIIHIVSEAVASTSGASQRKRMSAEERRTQIIACAREVFVERGMNGTRSRDIAERAGITEAYLYRHFHSKEELFQLAISSPFDALIVRLREETRQLADRPDVDRAHILQRAHELLLECMVEVAPLVTAALLSGSGPNNRFYADLLFPRLRDALVPAIPDITGIPVAAFDVDLFVEAMIGIHLTTALEHLLDGTSIDVPMVARQIAAMFATGVGRPTTKRVLK